MLVTLGDRYHLDGLGVVLGELSWRCLVTRPKKVGFGLEPTDLEFENILLLEGT